MAVGDNVSKINGGESEYPAKDFPGSMFFQNLCPSTVSDIERNYGIFSMKPEDRNSNQIPMKHHLVDMNLNNCVEGFNIQAEEFPALSEVSSPSPSDSLDNRSTSSPMPAYMNMNYSHQSEFIRSILAKFGINWNEVRIQQIPWDNPCNKPRNDVGIHLRHAFDQIDNPSFINTIDCDALLSQLKSTCLPGYKLYENFNSPFDEGYGNLACQEAPQLIKEYDLSFARPSMPWTQVLRDLSRATVETLCTLFHMTAGDVKYRQVACELYRRNWRYNRATNEWIKSFSLQEQTSTYQRGVFCVFCPQQNKIFQRTMHVNNSDIADQPPSIPLPSMCVDGTQLLPSL